MSDDRKSSQGNDLHVDDLHVKANQDRTGTTIILEGEFDMTGTERFWAFVSEALAAPRSMTVDASGPEFIDSSGLMALLRARTRPPSPVWRSVSATRHRRFGASLNCAESRTFRRPSDSERVARFVFWPRERRAGGPRGAGRSTHASRPAAC